MTGFPIKAFGNDKEPRYPLTLPLSLSLSHPESSSGQAAGEREVKEKR
jgi:hypothetical protein